MSYNIFWFVSFTSQSHNNKTYKTRKPTQISSKKKDEVKKIRESLLCLLVNDQVSQNVRSMLKDHPSLTLKSITKHYNVVMSRATDV